MAAGGTLHRSEREPADQDGAGADGAAAPRAPHGRWPPGAGLATAAVRRRHAAHAGAGPAAVAARIRSRGAANAGAVGPAVGCGGRQPARQRRAHGAECHERAGGGPVRGPARRPVPLRSPGPRTAAHGGRRCAALHGLPGLCGQRAARPRLCGRPCAHEAGAGRTTQHLRRSRSGCDGAERLSAGRIHRAGYRLRAWLDRTALAQAMGLGTNQQVLLAQTVGWPAGAAPP